MSRTYDHDGRGAMTSIPLRAVLVVTLALISGVGPAVMEPMDSVVARPSSALVDPGDLVIVEIMYNHPSGDDHDWLEVVNGAGVELDVSGVEIDGIGFTFPDGSAIRVADHVVVVADRVTFLADHPGVRTEAVMGEYGGRLSDGGERLTILGDDGTEISSARYDDADFWPLLADGLGYSIDHVGAFSITGALLTPDHPLAWRASIGPGGTPANLPVPLPREPIIFVNEVLASTDPPFEDAIELYNPNEMPVDLTGWHLSDDRTDLDSLNGFTIPELLTGVSTRFPIIGGLDHFVLYEADFGDALADGNFRLSGDGEGVFIGSPDLSMVRGADFRASEANMAYGRYGTSIGMDFAPLLAPTFGVTSPASVEEFRGGAGAPNSLPSIGLLFIEEILIDPTDPDVEFIELRNTGDEPIALWNDEAMTSTYRLDDAIGFLFGPGDAVPGDGRMVIVDADPDEYRAARDVPIGVPVVGPWSGGLNNTGETLRLQRRLFDDAGDPGGWLPIDHVDYEARSPWPVGEGYSMQRIVAPLEYGNDPVSWMAGMLGGSPGRRFEPSAPPTTTATPTVTPDGGTEPTSTLR